MKKLAVLLTFVFAVAMIAPAFAQDKKAEVKKETKDEKACSKECAKACASKETKACCAKDAKPAEVKK